MDLGLTAPDLKTRGGDGGRVPRLLRGAPTSFALVIIEMLTIFLLKFKPGGQVKTRCQGRLAIVCSSSLGSLAPFVLDLFVTCRRELIFLCLRFCFCENLMEN